MNQPDIQQIGRVGLWIAGPLSLLLAILLVRKIQRTAYPKDVAFMVALATVLFAICFGSFYCLIKNS